MFVCIAARHFFLCKIWKYWKLVGHAESLVCCQMSLCRQIKCIYLHVKLRLIMKYVNKPWLYDFKGQWIVGYTFIAGKHTSLRFLSFWYLWRSFGYSCQSLGIALLEYLFRLFEFLWVCYFDGPNKQSSRGKCCA